MTPNITDWITAIAALFGIGPIVWGVIKLFLRDKEKEERLRFMQEQLDEIKMQTSEFKYQSNLMKEANDLLEKQISIQSDIFLQSKDSDKRKIELEEQKRISETKPYFVYQSSSSSSDNFSIKVRNNGAAAENIKINDATEDLLVHPLPNNMRVEHGQTITIAGRTENTNSQQVSGKILLSYFDVDGREYFQNINKIRHGFNIDPPYLKKD